MLQYVILNVINAWIQIKIKTSHGSVLPDILSG